MAKPQQPEIARSGRSAIDPSSVKSELTAPAKGGGAAEAGGPVPEDNQPGHHPRDEQDKPSGDAFVQKVREHAQDRPAPERQAGDAEPEPEPTVAGEALRAAAGAVRKVREKLPGD